VFIAVVAVFIFLNLAKGIYFEWLWFDSLGYSKVYQTILLAKVVLFFSAAGIFCALLLGNLVLATRLMPRAGVFFWLWDRLPDLRRLVTLSILLGVAFLSLLFGLMAQGKWEVVLRFFNSQPFGITDPAFHRDVSFYVFSLPFFYLIRGWLLGALIVTLLITLGVYILSYVLQMQGGLFPSRRVLAHLAGLLVPILGIFAWSYWLGIWELVLSQRGVVFGASYADMHAKLPAQWLLFAVVLICILLVVAAVFRRDLRLPLYSIGGWVIIAIIAGGIFPAAIQRFEVLPNELSKEKPYIEYNIQFTREAFALNRIEEKPFPAEKTLSQEDITQNEVTINNVRLWDHRHLKDTFNQLQAIRLYYDFHDVDVDRYFIDGQYRQVMLAARELSAEKLAAEAQTWVNRRLQFTHGYGAALSPVNEISAEGLPVLLVKDIPPVGKLQIDRPQIYYGEKTSDYVIVGTKVQEFDYPLGEENVYGAYQGKGGVKLDGFLRRLVYAWQFADFNILISNQLTPESRVLYYRNIRERVQHLAPFLRLDDDPYLVIAEGRLLWIQDAYTTTDRYPYSQPLPDGTNYLRNSVKAVVDAYDGSVTLYVTEPEDALIQTYQAIFPTLFTPGEEMPDYLRAHLRYPEDMFDIQARVYQTYHMQDARVFYNKEDLWDIPRETYAGNEQLMEPYYIIMRLPEEEKEEFLLMLPFTPVNKNNAIAWLAARCDGENYGKLIAYHFPKEKLVYGPLQIENRIGQDTTITEQFALWGRGGSRVIRGNLLMIPMGKSSLYVEPVFLQAEGGGLPELKRVIVAVGDQIAMEATLSQSLAAVFGMAPPTPGTPPPGTPLPSEAASLVQQAQQHYTQAQEYLKAGDWSGYGEELNALKQVLDQLAELVSE
jgi:hypothetical protein